MIRAALNAAVAVALLVGCVGLRPEVPLPADRRSPEEIRLGFEYGQARFWNIQSAYIAENPDFDGAKIRFSLSIAPDGSVTECIPAPGIDAPDDLVAKVVNQVMKLKFGARDVPPFHQESYSITFIPRKAKQGKVGDQQRHRPTERN